MKIKINKLDRLFSEYIRTRAKGICEYCGQRKSFKSLQTSHFWGRRNKSVRWDTENAAALDFYCHNILGENPEIHRDWFKNRLGDKGYQALMLRANKPQKPDFKLIEMELNLLIKEL